MWTTCTSHHNIPFLAKQHNAKVRKGMRTSEQDKVNADYKKRDNIDDTIHYSTPSLFPPHLYTDWLLFLLCISVFEDFIHLIS